MITGALAAAAAAVGGRPEVVGRRAASEPRSQSHSLWYRFTRKGWIQRLLHEEWRGKLLELGSLRSRGGGGKQLPLSHHEARDVSAQSHTIELDISILTTVLYKIWTPVKRTDTPIGYKTVNTSKWNGSTSC